MMKSLSTIAEARDFSRSHDTLCSFKTLSELTFLGSRFSLSRVFTQVRAVDTGKERRQRAVQAEKFPRGHQTVHRRPTKKCGQWDTRQTRRSAEQSQCSVCVPEAGCACPAIRIHSSFPVLCTSTQSLVLSPLCFGRIHFCSYGCPYRVQY
jgi:hypothetical protein